MTARILVVDDIPANARLLEVKLAAEYYEVGIASDGAHAIAQARAWQPDAILLDVMMAGIDGYACCRMLKADAATQHIPVVMVTALSEPAERLAGLDSGADDFLTKPVDFPTLFARLRSLLRTKRLLDELRARGETGRALGIGVGPSDVASVAGTRALVIDDWEPGADLVCDALAKDGIVAVRAANRVEAMAQAAQAPDLIVLSLSLLTEDPLALASKLRADETSRTIPLLLLAEPAERGRVLRGFDLGANDWLLQPIDPRELRARSRNQIRRRIYEGRLRADLTEALSLAVLDPLTGLHNRRYILHHLGSLMRRAPPQPLAVLMIDIDLFKRVNDVHGHAVGDRTLRAVADRFRAGTRAFDSLARYGGEEFVLVMPGAGITEAVAAAERLRTLTASLPFSVLDTPGSLRITISVGVSVQARGEDPEALLRRADAALYRAKSDGRDRVCLADPPPCGVT